MTTPNWSARLVNPDGTLSRPLVDLLRSRGASDTDLTAITERLAALESEPGVRVSGIDPIRVFGSAESGYRISITGSAADPLAAQIFGG